MMMGIKKIYPYFLTFPCLFFLFSVIFFPLAFSFSSSFYNIFLIRRETFFIGFDNYIQLFRDPYFLYSLWVTAYFVAVTVSIEVSLGLGIALLLNEKFKGRSIVRGLILVPWALPSVVNGVMWKWIYHAQYGAFNHLLFQLGFISKYIDWLGDPFTALNMLVLADIWKETAFPAILTLAGLQAIPYGLYECAMIDGANAWQRFRYITLPLLKQILAVVIIFKTIWSFETFDLVYLVTRGGPSAGTRTLVYYNYLITFRQSLFGLGSAFSWIIAIMILFFAVPYIRRFMLR
jgi:multiple sugar transport system permease protein